jgi:type IV pilus biogenesis protein PilP
VARSQRVQPDVPSSALVARQATERNALRMNAVTLIGVYGSAGQRRALVRLPSGRYVNVQVGDRLDGGQVAAIDRDAVRYVKRGRDVVLQMPSG